jgi:hypothetical protein
MELVIHANGTVRTIYDETIQLASLGVVVIRRASHVEPATDGHWMADLAPVCGPQLGPFAHRSEALDAEHQWLLRHWLMSSD